VIQESGFNLPKLTAKPEFEQAITAWGWESLNGMIFEHENKTLALDFYAKALFSGKKYGSYV